jgi:hypothetical protein
MSELTRKGSTGKGIEKKQSEEKSKGDGACTKCACTAFLADPTDSDNCIHSGTYPNLCGHSKSSHN